ncbi:MAG: hypothetical protein IKJ37_10390, partial [Kiritimatiellae bacterium]|nr:hypothetical protein [Kiritimatiellia bacterium]
FLKRMPRSVLQSNWYYGNNFDLDTMRKERLTYVGAYELLDKAGFDQVPTGSNIGNDVNFVDTVKFCDTHCSPERIKGYMIAPWARTFASHEEKAIDAAAQIADAIKVHRRSVKG